MPLESTPRLVADCQAGGYAAGYCESWNLDSLRGVRDAAEQTPPCVENAYRPDVPRVVQAVRDMMQF